MPFPPSNYLLTILITVRYVTDKTSKLETDVAAAVSRQKAETDVDIEAKHAPTPSITTASSSTTGSPNGSHSLSPGVSARNYASIEEYSGGANYTFSFGDLSNGTCTFEALREKAAAWRSLPPALKDYKMEESRRIEVERAVASGLLFNVLDFEASELEYATFLVLRTYLDIYGWTDSQLRAFVAACRSLYRDAPYHNWSHAVDVLQFASSIVHAPSVYCRFSRIEVATAIITALVHDIDHDGITNKGHAALKTERVDFSTQSTQEKHHLRISWLLFERTFVAERLHKGLVDSLIDATDMFFHRKHVEILVQLINSQARFIESETERVELLIIIMKSADLSNTVRLGATARVWGDRLGDEFSQAYQREVEATVPTERSSFPNGDPTPSHDATQLSFYTHVILPFYTALADTPTFGTVYAPFVTNAKNGIAHFSQLVNPSKTPAPPHDLAP